MPSDVCTRPWSWAESQRRFSFSPHQWVILVGQGILHSGGRDWGQQCELSTHISPWSSIQIRNQSARKSLSATVEEFSLDGDNCIMANVGFSVYWVWFSPGKSLNILSYLSLCCFICLRSFSFYGSAILNNESTFILSVYHSYTSLLAGAAL